MGSNAGSLWLGLICVLLGLAQAYTTWDRHREFLRDAQMKQAQVTEVELVQFPGRGRPIIEHWIHFEFDTADGVRGGGRLPDDREQFKVGDSVAVYWHPVTLECRYASVSSLPLYGLAALGLGAVLLLYWFMHARYEDPAENEL